MAAGSHYTDQQRREAAVQYLLLGNLTAVAKVTSVPASTLADWARSSWWNTLVVELRAEKGAELDGAFTRIIHEATEHLLDRLKNGDPYVVSGEVRRKPVSARDLALVAAITYDKRALARNESPAASRDDNYLPGLAQYLEDYGKAHAQKMGWGQGKILRGED
jgi:hypothetical protein